MSAKLNRIIQAGRYDGSMIAPSTNISNISNNHVSGESKLDLSGDLNRCCNGFKYNCQCYL